ncbi:hypothetical protein [Cytophaga sp. FL35]|uniref:hypothetical protein n=1 Tax=Cytophaga sp. FL35 TaxID=1904456 RepID=UPI0016534F45|nr:hypothetical protein [Cytophaga sp. FL35]MBC7000717.1 hypothetical protein [Cytophaga sp. FL35]
MTNFFILKWIVLSFGAFIILAGFIMLFVPHKAQMFLRKFGSTNLINYTEITIRLIVSLALIGYADFSRLPKAFEVLGWFMFATSLILYLVPRKLHHRFSMKSADILKPVYFRLIAPIAFLLGGLIILNTIEAI